MIERCEKSGTPLSFCGEDAGRPVEALCFAALGLRTLSMRPASVGPVKHLLRRVDLDEVKAVMDQASPTATNPCAARLRLAGLSGLRQFARLQAPHGNASVTACSP